jgi:hypothetical protein
MRILNGGKTVPSSSLPGLRRAFGLEFRQLDGAGLGLLSAASIKFVAGLGDTLIAGHDALAGARPRAAAIALGEAAVGFSEIRERIV